MMINRPRQEGRLNRRLNPKRVLGDIARQRDSYTLLTNEIASLKSQIRRNSRINWMLVGLDWVVKIVCFWV